MEHELTPEMLAICDAERPIALAGVMGGADTEVSEKTRHIFLESAHFDPGSIRRTAKALGLTTEASYRFERYVDPELAPIALERACELLADLAGGEVVLGRLDLYPHAMPARKIALRPARVNALLGTSLERSDGSSQPAPPGLVRGRDGGAAASDCSHVPSRCGEGD